MSLGTVELCDFFYQKLIVTVHNSEVKKRNQVEIQNQGILQIYLLWFQINKLNVPFELMQVAMADLNNNLISRNAGDQVLCYIFNF
jgi:hypothetical protein